MNQKVMIVDDELIPRKIAEKALKDYYQVSTYENAESALGDLANLRPNIILADLHMPGMDGYAFLKEIRHLNSHELAEIPVVIMTSDEDSGSEVMGFDLGAYDYIRKPLLPDILIRRIERILKREETLKHLEKKADIDGLTGLLNRSACVQQINENLQMKKDSGLLLMLDLDRVKMVNDRFGHEAGDRVLAEVAKTLQGMVRSDDILGRIGGDEFILFYRGYWNEDALKDRCEEICDKVKSCVELVLNSSVSGKFGVSIGIAKAPQHGTDFLSLYQRADEAMYHVKSGGQGGYFVFAEEQEAEEEISNIVSLQDIQKKIEGKDAFPGAYMVEYNDFCSIYHFLKRTGERAQIPVQMVLFTVEESSDADRRGTESRMQSFGGLLSKTIRRGDVVVRCGNKQFMILLVGANADSSHIAIDRVMQQRSKEEQMEYPIRVEVNSLIG